MSFLKDRYKADICTGIAIETIIILYCLIPLFLGEGLRLLYLMIPLFIVFIYFTLDAFAKYNLEKLKERGNK